MQTISTYDLELNYWGGLVDFIIEFANSDIDTGLMEWSGWGVPCVPWYMNCNAEWGLPMIGVGR